MGQQRRYQSRAAPSWAATVGAMKDNGVEVYATCTKCGWTKNPLPLDPIIDRLGPDFSLFDRRSRCREPRLAGAPKCAGSVIYMYRPGGVSGTPFRPCKTEL